MRLVKPAWAKGIVRGLGAGVLVLALSGCFQYTALQHQAADPTTRPWWCESTGDGGGHAAHHYMGQTKGMLSWEDCLTLSANFDQALDYARQYPSLGVAETAGMHRLVNYATGMGTHNAFLGSFDPTDPSFDPLDPMFPGTALDDVFDPNKPEFLQYDGNGSDAKLVGMSWYVRTDNGMPPAGFAGNNDWWHTHELLCFSNSNFRVSGEGLTDEQCAAQAGTNLHLGNYFMIHAWIVPGWNHEPDVFVGHHPCLLATGPAACQEPGAPSRTRTP
ncbi:MAG TPA: hypothetical protein VFF40_05100 [Acidimicrobiia bacterium]|nr:hypothetical protein [Acidimicrobiia bacterium]